MLLGGNLIVIAIAFLAAVGIDRLQRAMSRRRLPGFYQQVAGGLLATLFAVVAALPRLSDVDPSLVVTASIVMLLAGIGFMGAVQDALTGFPLTAAARILEAMLATAGHHRRGERGALRGADARRRPRPSEPRGGLAERGGHVRRRRGDHGGRVRLRLLRPAARRCCRSR